MLSNQSGKQTSRAEGNIQGHMLAVNTSKSVSRNALDKYVADDLFVNEEDDGIEEEEGLHVLEVEEETDVELDAAQTQTAPVISQRDDSPNNNQILKEDDRSNGNKLTEQDDHGDDDQLDKPESDSGNNKSDQEDDEEKDEESEPTEEVTDNVDHEISD